MARSRSDVAPNGVPGGDVHLLDVIEDGDVVGETEIVPDKLSLKRFTVLRAEHETVRVGLTIEAGGPVAQPAASRRLARCHRSARCGTHRRCGHSHRGEPRTWLSSRWPLSGSSRSRAARAGSSRGSGAPTTAAVLAQRK